MYFKSTAPDLLAGQIASQPHPPDALAIILVAEHSELDIPALIAALNQHQLAFIGGIFPGVIYGNQRYESGAVVTFVPQFAAPILIPHLNQANFSEEDFAVVAEKLAQTEVHPTVLALVDGLTTNIELLLARMYRKLQNTVNYIGGGAGSLSLQQKPCLFDNNGFYQDAALIAFIGMTSQIGVRHGWRDLQGPFTARETKRNIVMKLDNEPAFKKYSEIVKRYTGQELTKKNFFEIAKGFPLGLYYQGADRIVRDPIAFTDDGGLVCVGEVPQGSLIHVLQGQLKLLVMAANRAAREAVGVHKKIDQVFVVDCISRVLFLQDQFAQELDTVLSALPTGHNMPVGILSLGEIGSYGAGAAEFFNKTIVICAMQLLALEPARVALMEQIATS
jgi:hypothetical protein